MTTTSMTTSARSQKMLKQEPTPYNIAATWSAFDMSTMAWYLGATLTVSTVDPQNTLNPDEEDEGDDEDSDDLSSVSGDPSTASASTTVSSETAWCYV